jgi:hypothetical protein
LTKAPEDSAPLGGPKIESQKERDSLVERDFMGKVRRLDESPEEAALKRVSLDADAKKGVDAILQARSAIVDGMVRENLELIINLRNAKESGDKGELVRLLGEVKEKLQPLAARGTLLQELKDAMPSVEYARVETMTKEYRQAIVDELREEAGPDGAKGGRVRDGALAGRESLLELGQQIRASYERQFVSRFARFEQVLAKLDLRPEQERSIRAMAREQFEKTKGRATPQEKRDLAVRILAVLEKDQQAKFLKATSEEMPD